MNRVLVPTLGGPGDLVRVPGPQSHHLLHVQRVARGRNVEVIDGAGRRGLAVLTDVIGGEAILTLIEVGQGNAPPARTVMLGMPKPPAVEEALTLGAEAGATRFLLVEADRTPPGQLRPDRIDRILKAALTQCGRPDLPLVEGPLSLAVALTRVGPGARWLASPPSATDGPPDGARAPGRPPGGAVEDAATIAIGPEGGWSQAELVTLYAAGFEVLTLGPWVLRTPTAVAAALGAIWPSQR